MTLKIKMTDQREAGQPDIPFQNQTSCLVTDMMELHPAGWLHTLKYINRKNVCPDLEISQEKGAVASQNGSRAAC